MFGVLLVQLIALCSSAAIQIHVDKPVDVDNGMSPASIHSDINNNRDEVLLSVIDQPKHDNVVPLTIVMDDDFSKLKQLPSEIDQPTIGAHKSKVTYALDILNDKLPEGLEKCYRNMSVEVLESNVYSPASYGDKLCG